MFKDIFLPPPTTLFKVFAHYGGEYPSRVMLFNSYESAVQFAQGAEQYEIIQVK